MINLNTISYNSSSALRAFLEKEGLGMRKKYGQNFLINPVIRQALIQALDCNAEDAVWEIGPGLGAMTALLLERGLSVRAFEIDAGFIRVLKKIFADETKFSLVEGDVMKTWSVQKPAQFLFGNLPYNAAAALLADLTEKRRIFTRIVVTVQKEVALRMAASAGSPDYSSFSVLCASAYNVKPLMVIRPASFYPKPNVDSMGVLLEKKSSGAEQIPDVFFQLVRALFSSRRKTIKNNLTVFLSSVFGNLQDICPSLLSENGLTGNERAENLDFESFLSLAKSIENMRK
jgi:16S rRNA (adenine1518-N6/adenine1519-N6)-dimethyltransferase